MKAASAGNNLQAGNSALEVLIALAILTMIMTSVIVVTFGNQTVSADGPVNSTALYQANLSLEKARATSRQNFPAVISSSSTDDLYTRTLSVTDVTPCRKQVASRITWATDPSRPQTIDLVSDIADVAGTALGGDWGADCGTAPTDPWTSPTTSGTVDLGQSKGTGVDVKGKIAYLSADATAVAKDDFFIVNVNNPGSPVLAGHLNTGIGLNAVDVAGQYAYVVSQETTAQLQVIDVSNINAPVVVATKTLPIPVGTATGLSVFYYNARLYVGASYTASTTSHEFHIYDVADPVHPVNLGHIDVGRNVNGIYVQGTKAYLAVGSSAGDLKDIIIYDVSNAASITQLGFLDLPGGGGKSLFLVGTKLYLGCFKSGGKNDFYVIDVTTPATPTILGQKTLGADINNVKVSGTLAFLATNDSNKEFQVWNISNPATITAVSSINFPQAAVGLDYDGQLVYAAFRSNDPLKIIAGH